MSGFLDWLKGALAVVYDKDGLRGVTVIALLGVGLLVVVVVLLTLTPLGDWVAKLLGIA